MQGSLIGKILISCALISMITSSIFAVGNDVSTCGNILYVDDDGGADYVRIQDAIDNASDGDTVFVYSGTYFENLVVDKSINLIGEDKNTTIIDGRQLDNTIWIKTSSVRLSRLSVVNSKPGLWGEGISVIEKQWWNVSDPPILLSDIIISDCIIKNNSLGICLTITDNVEIVNCEISGNSRYSILMTESSNVDVHHCVVHHNGRENAGCITLKYSPDRENSGCKNVTIHNCTIFDNILSAINIGGYSTNIRVCHNEIYGQTSTGIVITENSNAYVYENIIIANGKNTNLGNGILIQDCIDSAVVRRNIISSNNPYGAYLLRSSKNTIVENNFINNTRNNANFKVYFFSGNYWDRNYWDDWRGFGPKIIFGKIYKTWFPWVDFDWNPAGEPYEINL